MIDVQENNGRNVNVTTELVRQFADTKERKELLGVCILGHLWRNNGVVWNFTYRNAMKWLHVGKPKAKRLIQQMKECKRLFSFNGDVLSCRSLRDKSCKRTRNGRNFSGAICACIKANRDYTLKDIYNIINDIIVLARIKATTGRTIFSIVTHSVSERSFLTCRTLAESLGMSRSSAMRITNRLRNNGVIIKDPAIEFLALDSCHKREIQRALDMLNYKHVSYTSKQGYSYIIIPNGYAIDNIDAYNSIRHKIYGYKDKNFTPSSQSTVPQLNGL